MITCMQCLLQTLSIWQLMFLVTGVVQVVSACLFAAEPVYMATHVPRVWRGSGGVCLSVCCRACLYGNSCSSWLAWFKWCLPLCLLSWPTPGDSRGHRPVGSHHRRRRQTLFTQDIIINSSRSLSNIGTPFTADRQWCRILILVI